MKNRMVLFVCFLSLFYSCKLYAKSDPIDSIKIVSLDAGWTYIPSGSYNVEVLMDYLDEKLSWSNIEPDSKIKYKCVIKERKWIKRFERLLSRCPATSDIDLSYFPKIQVRIGLKVFSGNQTGYMFIQPKSVPHNDKYIRFIITQNTELHASRSLIRFLKTMSKEERCQRCFK